MSFRDRFFTPKVARSITDAPAIVAVGAGVSLAILAGLGPIGAVIGGAAFLAGRVGVAIPRKDRRASSIDAFSLKDPWRRMVTDAQAAGRQFDDTVRRARQGAIRDELESLRTGIEESVLECWRVAQAGHELTTARARIDVFGAQRELDELQSTAGASATVASTARALEAQLATAARMDATIGDARDRLRLLNARLDEAVTRSIELSASSAGADQFQRVGADVAGIVDEMEALRQALDVVNSPGELPGQTPDQTPGQ